LGPTGQAPESKKRDFCLIWGAPGPGGAKKNKIIAIFYCKNCGLVEKEGSEKGPRGELGKITTQKTKNIINHCKNCAWGQQARLQKAKKTQFSNFGGLRVDKKPWISTFPSRPPISKNMQNHCKNCCLKQQNQKNIEKNTEEGP